MDNLIITEWKDRMARGLFFTSLAGSLASKVPGRYGLLKTVNLKRLALKRKPKTRSPSPERSLHGERVDDNYTLTYRPVSAGSFNFTKANPDEVLYKDGNDYVIINASPIGFGHFLFCPEFKSVLPQRLTRDVLGRAIEFCGRFERPDFRMGFNSTGAHSSVNHLHFHGMWLKGEFENALSDTSGTTWISDEAGRLFDDGMYPLEKIPCLDGFHRQAKNGSVIQIVDAPFIAVRFNRPDHLPLTSLVEDVWSMIDALLERDVAHNLVITKHSVFVAPRKLERALMLKDSLQGFGLQVATVELGGLLICCDEPTYNSFTEEDYVMNCRNHVSFSLEDVRDFIIKVLE